MESNLETSFLESEEGAGVEASSCTHELAKVTDQTGINNGLKLDRKTGGFLKTKPIFSQTVLTQ